MLKDKSNSSERKKLSRSSPERNSKVIRLKATKWAQLPDANQVQGISDSDSECIRDLRDVLKKHDALGRFGIELLHQHFKIEDDEFLLETTDVTKRIQLIRPVKFKNYFKGKGVSLMTTSVKMVEGDEVMMCNRTCVKEGYYHYY